MEVSLISSTEHFIMMMDSFSNEDIYRKRNGRRAAIMVLVTLIYFLTGAEDKEDDVRGVVVPTTTNKTDAPPIAPLNSELKIYVYDLPFEYSLENYIKTVTEQTMPRSNCDWNMNVCKEEEWVGVSIYYEYVIMFCNYLLNINICMPFYYFT